MLFSLEDDGSALAILRLSLGELPDFGATRLADGSVRVSPRCTRPVADADIAGLLKQR